MTGPSQSFMEIVPGDVVAAGSNGSYRRLRSRPAGDYVLRDDILRTGGDTGERLATLVHLTDLHVADTASPARLDFAMREGAGDPAWQGLVDWVFRPHELLGIHTAAAMVRRLAEIAFDACVVTGDNIDNAQSNELAAYLNLLDGGPVEVFPGGRYDGVQDASIGDSWYWTPEDVPDEYKRRWGFPAHPGLIDRALQPVLSAGLGRPWLASAGNHDLLVGGSCARAADLLPLVTGSAKPVRLPPGEMADPLQTYLTDPRAMFAGPHRPVRPEPARRFITPAEFVAAHHRPGARPAGHGFGQDQQLYYAYDLNERIRVLALSTDNLDGHWDGSVDSQQFDWLVGELERCRGRNAPFVILASHHASRSLGNSFGTCDHDPRRRVYAERLIATALHYPNIILWLNGHHHANRIVAHHHGSGFFEITTAAVVDWPSQARLLEISGGADGAVSVVSTVIDHHGPVDPAVEPGHPDYLAGLHRELAFNDSARAGRQHSRGGAGDRNVVLRIPVT